MKKQASIKGRLSTRLKQTGYPDTLRIRRARASDLPAITMLYRELHLSNYASFEIPQSKMKRAFARLARDRRNHVLVAESGGRLLGTAHLIIFDHLGHGLAPMAVVENVVVASDARSMGVGQRLMEAIGDIARRARCYKIALTSNISRTGAHRFYERLGWKRTHYGYSIGVD